jgi:hypothetical protein
MLQSILNRRQLIAVVKSSRQTSLVRLEGRILYRAGLPSMNLEKAVMRRSEQLT